MNNCALKNLREKTFKLYLLLKTIRIVKDLIKIIFII